MAANRLVDEFRDLWEEKGSLWWKASGMLLQGRLLALTDKAVEAVQVLTSGLTAHRSTGATLSVPSYLVDLTIAYADLGQFDDGTAYWLFAAIFYALAKPFEFYDTAVYSAGGILSGHTLKHFAAAAACGALLRYFQKRRPIAVPNIADSTRELRSTGLG